MQKSELFAQVGRGLSDFFPPEGVYHMFDVTLQEGDDGRQGVVVGNEVEIKCAPDEIRSAVGKVELAR